MELQFCDGKDSVKRGWYWRGNRFDFWRGPYRFRWFLRFVAWVSNEHGYSWPPD